MQEKQEIMLFDLNSNIELAQKIDDNLGDKLCDASVKHFI